MDKALAIAAILLLCGCDDRKCLYGHNEEYWYTTPIFIGMNNNVPQHMYMPQTGIAFVCDQYEQEHNNGK